MSAILSDTIISGNLTLNTLLLWKPLETKNGGLGKDVSGFAANSLLLYKNGILSALPVTQASKPYYDYKAYFSTTASENCTTTASLVDNDRTTRTIYITYDGAALTADSAILLGYYNGQVRPVGASDITAGRVTCWKGYNASTSQYENWQLSVGSDPESGATLAIL